MRKMTKGWGAVAAAVALGLGLSAGDAEAQGVPAGCVASNPNGAAAGALLGGIAGALLGNAVAGRHKAGGTIIGGVAGAATGAAIGGSQAVPCPQGYAYEGPPPGAVSPPLVVNEGDVWYGAPPRIDQRISFLRHRVDMLDSDGWLSPRESGGLRHRLADIAQREESIRDRNGGHLPPEARERLSDDLNDVANHLRWKEYRTQHAAE